MEAHQKAILKAIDKIPAFVINEGDIDSNKNSKKYKNKEEI